jgi:protein ATS1
MDRRIQLLASGSNGSGQLGIGHAEDVSTYTYCRFSGAIPNDIAETRLSGLPGVVLAVASSARHSLLLMCKDDKLGGCQAIERTIWTTGTNHYNQLGPAYIRGSSEPSHSSWKRLDYISYIEAAGLPIGAVNRYTAKEVACSWSTSIICFEHSTQNSDGTWSKVSDKTISFGTNDFGELGCGIEGDPSGSANQEQGPVHIVQLPQTRRSGEILSVRKIKASHRNIVCICDWLSDAEENKRIVDTVVYGWGAGRQGQLDVRTAIVAGMDTPSTSVGQTVDSASSTLIKPDMAGRARTGAKERSSKSAVRGASAARATGGPRLRKSDYPSSYSKPVEVEVASAAISKTGLAGDLTVDDLAVGAGHVLFRISTVSGDQTAVIGLGSNAKHQLDLNRDPVRSASPRWEKIACTWNGSFLTEKGPGGRIWSTGTNTHGQLGQGRPVSDDRDAAATSSGLQPVVALPGALDTSTIHDIVSGSEHVLAVTQAEEGDRRVWTWGWNEHGNLGLGDDDLQDRWKPVEVPLDVSQRLRGAWASCGTTWLLVETI